MCVCVRVCRGGGVNERERVCVCFICTSLCFACLVSAFSPVQYFTGKVLQPLHSCTAGACQVCMQSFSSRSGSLPKT